MTLYVGNISYFMKEEDLKAVFSEFGNVTSVKIISFKNGKSKGYGFVDFAEDAEGEAAIAAMNGQEVHGRKIIVNVAHTRKEE